jgi:hypothetical protein
LIISRLGGRAVATDGDEGLLALLQDNLAANRHRDEASVRSSGGVAEVMLLGWGSPAGAELTRRRLSEADGEPDFPDLVVAADVVYPSNADAWGPLLDTFDQLSGPRTVTFIAHTKRAAEVSA